MHYPKLKNIWLYYASISSAEGRNPTIHVNEVTEFVRRSNLLGHVSLARMDQTLIATNMSNNNFKRSAARELERYEFLEFIIRIAQAKYENDRNTTKTHSLADLTNMVIK